MHCTQDHAEYINFDFQSSPGEKGLSILTSSSRNPVFSHSKDIRDDIMYVSQIKVLTRRLSEKYITLFAKDQIMLCEKYGYRGCHVLIDSSCAYAQEIGNALVSEGFAKTPSLQHKNSDVYSYSIQRATIG